MESEVQKSMTREELEEIFHIRKEIQDLNKRIDKYKYNPKIIKSKGTCSSSSFPYTEKHYMVECAEYNPKMYTLKLKLEKFKKKLEMKEKEIEDYIEIIPFSEIRQIFRYRYLDGMNWIQVAHQMNSKYNNREYSDGSVRLKHDRYLEKIEKN